MSLFAELKRRKVVHVGIAYVVVGWAAVQAASIGFPVFGAPDWALRVFIFVVLLGFPIAVVMAWVLDATPEGLKLETATFGNKRVFTIAAVLAALAVGWFLRGGWEKPGSEYSFGSKHEQDGSAGPKLYSDPGFSLGERSTAVLPFVNMSADKDNEYFSDGLTETLLHKLAQVSELKVAARTSSFAFKGANKDVRAIGTELGVATVVEGSVQRAGDTLRITAQLVRTADGSHIWSKSYDRKLADLFAIQDEIAGAVTQALVGALVPEAKAAIERGGTTDLVAYEAHTRGLQQLARETFDSLRQAEKHFQQALARDPGYVDAMLALASTWEFMQGTGLNTEQEFVERVTPLLDRIESADPGNGVVLGFRARLALGRADRKLAAQLFERAIAAAPNEPRLLDQYAAFLVASRKRQEALEIAGRAAAGDPLNPSMHLGVAGALFALTRLPEAEQAARRALELDAGNPSVYAMLQRIADARGDPAAGIAWLMEAHRADPRDHELPAVLAVRLEELGESGAADAWLAKAQRIAPGHLFVEKEGLRIAFLRGDLERVVDHGLSLVPRDREDVKNSWSISVRLACLAAQQLGRVAAVRATLVEQGVLPREFTVPAHEALTRAPGSLQVRAIRTGFLAPCLFEPGGGDPAQRQQMLAVFDEVAGADWAEPRGLWFIDGYLRGDRERLVEALLPEPGFESQLFRPDPAEHSARFYGVADDPRLVAHYARMRAGIEGARAALPQRLAERGLNVLPEP